MVPPLQTTLDDVEDAANRGEIEADGCITDFAAREALIREWDQIRRSRIPVRHFTPAAIAILMIAPLEHLRDLLQSCKQAPDALFDGVMSTLNKDGTRAISSYIAGRTPYELLAGLFWTIDGKEVVCPDNPHAYAKTCIVTGKSGFVDVVFLFPHVDTKKETHSLQSILKTFWGEKAVPWITTCTNPDFIESLQNHITLDPMFRSPFIEGRLAFKPLRSADPNERRIQLHRLKRSPFRVSDFCFHGNPLERGRDGEKIKAWGDRFLPGEIASIPITTETEPGRILTIRADNPADLPDWDMLELQWDLVRVAAFARAGVDDDGDGGDDMDDEYDEYDRGGDDDDVEFLRLDQE
ncbi:hypothetical protein LCI18_002906 [Fusarium solani-melongenae]|uniref:Uncharacterized protein n=1 Tax=Fusarium solani subsp. cucurbitae TaxID=2747967 RepID=A0ACD3YTP0_FUSSC|nr:hypothetical protein LCI18_002906 [Fusarium solani-melongenae]